MSTSIGVNIVAWQYLGRGWLYCEIIFLLPTIFGEGVVISWHYFFFSDNIWGGGDYIVKIYFTPNNIWGGVIISWHYIFTPDIIWGGGDYTWKIFLTYIRDIMFSLLTIFGRGWLYCDIIFSLPTIFGEGVIISWHHIFTPDYIWWGGWLHRDIIFSLPTIFGEGVIISWHYIFTPLESGTGGDNIWISSLPTFDSAGGRRYQAVLSYIFIFNP